MKVFIADDQLEILDLLKLYLGRQFLGCKIKTFPDGSSVIQAMEEVSNPSGYWLITDFNMPGANGDQVIETAKRCGFNSQKIILITGYGISGAEATENANRASELGIRAVVMKPDIVKPIIKIIESSTVTATC